MISFSFYLPIESVRFGPVVEEPPAVQSVLVVSLFDPQSFQTVFYLGIEPSLFVTCII